MAKKSYDVQIVRRDLNDANVLFVKGGYCDEVEEQNIRIYADNKEVGCTEKIVLDEADCDGMKQEAKSRIKSYIWAKVPELNNVKKIKIIYESKNRRETVLVLSGALLKRALRSYLYNIDALEKIGDSYVIRGWGIYETDLKLQILDDSKNEIESNECFYERTDVEMVYPEVNGKKNVSGFRVAFKCENVRNLEFRIILDENIVTCCFDTMADFSGNKQVIPVLRKSLANNGVWGTIIIFMNQVKHPVLLLQRVSNKLGITSYYRNAIKRIKTIKNNIEEHYLAKCKYGELMGKYPYAMKRLLCLREMPQIKQEKQNEYKGDIKFSVLVPLYNTPVEFLNEMIESVQMQTYANWELCLADGSDEKHSYVEEICKHYQKNDERILYKKLSENYGISGNTNECIKMATGNYIALFDHDDFLHPRVLRKCYDEIKNENADYVYTDEATFQVRLDNIGTYHFKPDYAPDTLRANNYICHFSTFSKQLLDRVGWYDSKYDGSQDHDLILRLTEKATCVKHIQEILYFWRSHPGSVAEDINSKVYAIEAGKRAVLASLERSGMSGKVESSKAFPTIYRIKYDLLDKPMISIVILSRNKLADLKKCMESIRKKSVYPKYEVIIVRTSMGEDDVQKIDDEIEDMPEMKIIEWVKPYSESAMSNFAVKSARGKYVLFLNREIEIITSEWMEEMLMYAQRKDVGAVGAKLYYIDGTIRHAGMVLGMGVDRAVGRSHYRCQKNELGYMGRLFYSQNVSAVTSECMMVDREVFDSLGGFDEAYINRYYDIDFCLKLMKKGYLNVFTPYAEALQISSTRLSRDGCIDEMQVKEDSNRFKGIWREMLERGDKYFNRNFSLDYSCFVMEENQLFRK